MKVFEHKGIQNITCFVCRKKGHMANDCFDQKSLADPKEKEKSANVVEKDNDSDAPSSDEGVIEVALAEFDSCIDSSQNWYLDSGASHHVTGFAQNLTKVKPKAGGKVNCVRGEPHYVTWKESAHVNGINLTNVLYVLTFKCSLVFVKVLTQAGNVVVFVGDSCWILDNKKSRKVVGAGIIDPLNGLYKQTTNSKSVGVHVNFVFAVAKTQLWHKRYGHLHYSSLKQLSKKRPSYWHAKVRVCKGSV